MDMAQSSSKEPIGSTELIACTVANKLRKQKLLEEFALCSIIPFLISAILQVRTGDSGCELYKRVIVIFQSECRELVIYRGERGGRLELLGELL